LEKTKESFNHFIERENDLKKVSI